ncbi:MAG: hypothetical protein NC827_07495, partial [Candidatus Omnitrophica bacterium]|nr:hypothetical protein [Candidatus Omnitrophota bacterium]
MTKKNELILFLIVLFVYINSIFNPFIFDDYYLIINNSFIKNFKFFKKYFTTNLFAGGGEKGLFYRPLQTLIYAFIYKISGFIPVGYHLINIFFHSGCAILI